MKMKINKDTPARLVISQQGLCSPRTNWSICRPGEMDCLTVTAMASPFPSRPADGRLSKPRQQQVDQGPRGSPKVESGQLGRNAALSFQTFNLSYLFQVPLARRRGFDFCPLMKLGQYPNNLTLDKSVIIGAEELPTLALIGTRVTWNNRVWNIYIFTAG
ncbi:hypothetical protein PCASD_24329 [Puccinia coronata f. sp. avenae]|uniref:Uncharacterized protein n=1 Tax=Puccinia coronata f. sp. avenae TaxID=200324 RepID=A0A2N5RYU6_9BASI|nr:hypothetical protein PCASD_24329 [Puccinia coronata f. sp. avenae]